MISRYLRTAVAVAFALAFAFNTITADKAPAAAPMVVAVDSVTGQATVMKRQQSCPNNQVCFYGCHLSGTCGYWFTIAGTFTGCTNIFAKHVDIQSVRNESSWNFRVYHNSSCTSGGNTSVLYEETDGNMNLEWEFDGIGSAKRLLN